MPFAFVSCFIMNLYTHVIFNLEGGFLKAHYLKNLNRKPMLNHLTPIFHQGSHVAQADLTL